MIDFFILNIKMAALAFLIDLILGDPRWFPHPVRGMGWLNTNFEKLYRRIIKHEITAGTFAAFSVLLVSGGIAWGIMYSVSQLSDLLIILTGSILIYFCIAARDLMTHALKILKPLRNKHIEESRQKLSMIVGRDTENLDDGQISRATVESVAENTVDGVTSPLFYALLAGPIGAVIYRAINTMDSMFAYKNEKYLYFGRIPAYLDDIANYIPARLSGLFICLAAVCGQSPVNAWKIMRRDGQKHPSPNSGISEAAIAGALQIQLGGPSSYSGVISNKETLGDPIKELTPGHISQSIIMMYLTSIIFITIPALVILFITIISH
jgi:adenosylcobinamide-phosphate synthase